MTDDHEYFKNKRTDRVYLSRSLENKVFQRTEEGEVQEIVRPFRIVSKIVEETEGHKFIKDGKEISLRITDGERQEITAKFYEDTRGLFTLQIQKYTKETGVPHNQYFTFIGDEILTLYNFLRNIAVLPLESNNGARLDDRFIEELVLTKEQALQLLHDQPELIKEIIKEIIKSDVTKDDVANLGFRREQLEKFRKLLNEPIYFQSCMAELGSNKGKEDVWQSFFETNTWIFGYGLSYVFNSPLEGEKLEQIISGTDFTEKGKRVDALLHTKGVVSVLAFGEIKTHETYLLSQAKKPYRGESWAISSEVAGGIAQVQRSVQKSIENLQTKYDSTDDSGDPTGEQLFLYEPKAFLVVGSLGEFETELGINEEKFSSFELFRRNLHNPELITFDELYERAKYIVQSEPDSGGSS